MCGRYYIPEEDSAEELRAIIYEVNRKTKGAPIKKGEIRPTDVAPVLANNRAMIPSAFAMKWGYSLPDGKVVFNARSESASSRPMFQDGMAQRRCLVPAAYYFEWEKRGREKIKYAIGQSDRGILYMAGIYRMEKGVPVFTILTRSSADSIAFIHDRMPVILPDDVKADWLNPKYAADDLIRHAATEVQFKMA